MKSIADYQTEFMLIKRFFRKIWNRGCDYSSHRKDLLLLILVVDINCELCTRFCFPLRTVALRGHGFSLLEKPTLRGLQTRAIPAGVNGPPLQTTIVRLSPYTCVKRIKKKSHINSL